MELKQDIVQRLDALEKKYAVMGQDMISYLDGLLYADYLTYWDYIHLDTLLSLQTPKTNFKDEVIFIGYHQITELYFKLILWEMAQINEATEISEDWLLVKVGRCVRYFQTLVHSFDVMVDGMDKDEFLKFRMSLLPASGFQSAQYRKIELCSTDFVNLIYKEKRWELGGMEDLETLFEHLYWKNGGRELKSGKKTLTLEQFEGKYDEELLRLAHDMSTKNIWQQVQKLCPQALKNEKLVHEMRNLDIHANVQWPHSHLKSAVRYLKLDPEDIKATGGTNWQKYLPPKIQFIMFFPELWTKQEKEDWGRKLSSL
ncbi:MAG: tryptophan 2,3-dioxygenase [Sphingobacteriales bacterium]|jgi:tryptophan 2,3-dioxygenase